MSPTAIWFSIGAFVAILAFLLVVSKVASLHAAGKEDSSDAGLTIFISIVICGVGSIFWPGLLVALAAWAVWARSQASYRESVQARKEAKQALIHEAESWEERAKLTKRDPDMSVAAKARAKDLRAQAEALG